MPQASVKHNWKPPTDFPHRVLGHPCSQETQRIVLRVSGKIVVRCSPICQHWLIISIMVSFRLVLGILYAFEVEKCRGRPKFGTSPGPEHLLCSLIHWFITCLLTRDVFFAYRAYWRAQVKLHMWMDVVWTTRTAPNVSFCFDIPHSITYWRKTLHLLVTR